MAESYVCIWEYVVREDRRADFIEMYGLEGDWVRLFRSAPGYLGTELLRDQMEQTRFVTIDRWVSQEAFDAFLASRREAYEALDATCAAFTVSERQMGHFAGSGND